jgi:ParB/RepB/Spo0J family partition protein
MDQIVNGKNIRNEKDAEITELAASILAQGLINPILVKKREKDGKYVVIAGHRRYEAVKYLGLPHIECNIVDEDLNDKDIVLTQIAENVQRKNMSAWELVEVFDDLKRRHNLNQKQIGKMFGKSDVWVANQYQAVRQLDSMYGGNIPEEAKKLSYGKVKAQMQDKMGIDKELIICAGMKIKVVGHTYHISCIDNKAENDLRAFIEKRRGKDGKH